MPASFCLASASAERARAEGLSDVEKTLVHSIDGHVGDAVTLLEKVVNIPSASHNQEGVRAVGKVLAPEFERLGFTTRWDAPPGHKNVGHLIAEHAGTRGKRLLLIGHLDTVLEGRPFRRDPEHPNRASGNGTVDMKGGDVVLLFALRALHEAGRLEDRRVAVILTGDEESVVEPVEASRRSMVALARQSDIALAFEAGDGATATVARRGVSSWSLRVKARSGHSSGIFNAGAGAGAIYESARILDGFRQELTGQRGLTVNVSLFLGGTEISHESGASQGSASGKSNVIPGEVYAHGDLRFLNEGQRTTAEATMRAIVAKSLPKATAELIIENEYPAMAPTPGNYAVLATLDRVSRDLDLGPIRAFDPTQRGAGDISFVAPFVDGLDGLGAHGGRSHTAEEWVDLSLFPAQIQRAALLINRLTHEEPADEKKP